ncbi:MAG TPA: molecular chaperone TorD family protein [Sinorhizobium sp.]|nr:molecular chaperone TorD family protein [Sinorhizobium sp.]
MPVSAAAERVVGLELTEEDGCRSALYRLLGRVLTAPPDESVLTALAGLQGNESPLGQALDALSEEARRRPSGLEREYHDLFIGLGRGELVPYGSYYLTGFLNEKPLAVLRRDMARLGIARRGNVREPEDHIGAVLEMMAGLIEGSFAVSVGDVTAQQHFFAAHIQPVAPRFFADLEKASAAAFYRPVGTAGRLFLEVEASAFQMT